MKLTAAKAKRFCLNVTVLMWAMIRRVNFENNWQTELLIAVDISERDPNLPIILQGYCALPLPLTYVLPSTTSLLVSYSST